MIAQSVVHGRPSKRPAQQLASTKSRKRTISPAVHEPPASTPRERYTKKEEKEAAISFTRVPAKEAPRPRASRTVSKHQSALTGNVPAGPVAVPNNKGRQLAPGAEAALPAVVPAASAFGQAIARGLATLPD